MRRGIIISLVPLICLCGTLAFGRAFKERAYQKEWCVRAGGKMEFTLPDKSRVDCLTEEYAVEVDFASKWAEALGQALYYSIQTGKRPGILLILEDDKDKRFLERANSVAQRLGIRMWTASKAELESLQR